jgi:tungstate transport system substrate-binding protein
MIQRRALLQAGVAGLAGFTACAHAQQRKSLADPLRLGVDRALIDSGLARALQRSFGRDTGIAVQLVPGAALPLLEALERGEFDATLSNAPDAETRLEKLGLAHDRRTVAIGAMALVGPAPQGKGKRLVPDPAGVAGGRDIADALQRLATAAATPGTLQFLSAGDGSGTHAAEQMLWRAAKVAPASAWYAAADKTGGLIAQARARNAYALVERGAWADQGGAPLALLVEGDSLLDLPVHVMRSFRVNHPAGKIFASWIAGPKGARVVAAQRGYRAPKR